MYRHSNRINHMISSPRLLGSDPCVDGTHNYSKELRLWHTYDLEQYIPTLHKLLVYTRIVGGNY